MYYTKNNVYKAFLVLFCCGLFIQLQAQSLHTPTEIKQLMDKSSIKFVLDTLSQPILPQNDPVMDQGWYAIESTKGVQLDQPLILTNKKALKYQSKANKYLKKAQFSKAKKYFKAALKESPNSNVLLKQLATTYIKARESSKAEEILIKALTINPIDFQAHELLADIYRKEKNKAAVKHISFAHVLNRNDQTIIAKLQKIYEANNLVYDKWRLTPQYKIEKIQKELVSIDYNGSPWMAYGSCKAIWKYEDGYKENMGHLASVDTYIIEEKECLLNALINYEGLEEGQEKYPELKALGLALEYQYIDDYILYEKISVANPSIMSKLSVEQLERIIYYITDIRAKKLLEQ